MVFTARGFVCACLKVLKYNKKKAKHLLSVTCAWVAARRSPRRTRAFIAVSFRLCYSMFHPVVVNCCKLGWVTRLSYSYWQEVHRPFSLMVYFIMNALARYNTCAPGVLYIATARWQRALIVDAAPTMRISLMLSLKLNSSQPISQNFEHYNIWWFHCSFGPQ